MVHCHEGYHENFQSELVKILYNTHTKTATSKPRIR